MPSPVSQAIRSRITRETGPNPAPLAEQRQAWIDYAETLPLHPDVETHDETIGGVPCLWLTPRRPRPNATILYLHGGGLVDGAILTHREFVSRIVALTGHKALLIGYRLLPDNVFPAPLEDALAVYRALVSENRISPASVAFGGDSSGAGLAIAALMQLARRGEPMPACAFSISGTFDLTLSGESMTSRDSVDPCLSRAALESWIRHFEGLDLADERLSPLFGDPCGLPPVLLQVGDHEVWLDDSKRLAAKIECSGGSVQLSIWEDMWHVWPLYPELPEAGEAIEEIGRFIDAHAVARRATS